MTEKNIKEIVLDVLQECPKSRANDNELVYEVLIRLGMPTDYRLLKQDPTNKVMTIVRMRQKAQMSNPMLRPEAQVSKRRKQLEERCRKEYSRNNV